MITILIDLHYSNISFECVKMCFVARNKGQQVAFIFLGIELCFGFVG